MEPQRSGPFTRRRETRSQIAKLPARPCGAQEHELLRRAETLGQEARGQGEMSRGADFAEGVQAFFAKRPAVFKDRWRTGASHRASGHGARLRSLIGLQGSILLKSRPVQSQSRDRHEKDGRTPSQQPSACVQPGGRGLA